MKAAKEKGEVHKAEEFENGDTLRQLLARSRYLLFKSPDKWTKSQKIRAELLFKQFEDIKHVYYYSLELGKIFSTNYDKDVARAKLALWYNKIEEYGYDTFTTVANSIENHYEKLSDADKEAIRLGREVQALRGGENTKDHLRKMWRVTVI